MSEGPDQGLDFRQPGTLPSLRLERSELPPPPREEHQENGSRAYSHVCSDVTVSRIRHSGTISIRRSGPSARRGANWTRGSDAASTAPMTFVLPLPPISLAPAPRPLHTGHGSTKRTRRSRVLFFSGPRTTLPALSQLGSPGGRRGFARSHRPVLFLSGRALLRHKLPRGRSAPRPGH